MKGLGKRVYQPTVDCDICVERRYTRESFKSADKLVRGLREPLDFVRSNLCRPMGIALVGKSKYLVTLYDDNFAVSAVPFIQENNLAVWD